MPHILLVDDEAIIAACAAMLLEDAGYSVDTAADGREGVEQAIRQHPDLIVTDFMMPKMNGAAMVQELRARGIVAPVILTTSAREEVVGGHDYDVYLRKPYFDRELLALVRRFLPQAE